jgi:hypothetical protein
MKRRPKPIDEKEARKIARKMIAPALPAWGDQLKVDIFRPADGSVMILRGGKFYLRFRPGALSREGLATIGIDDVLVALKLLIDLVAEQAMIANWTHPFAAADVHGTQLRAKKAGPYGKASAKKSRPAVERLMRDCLKRKEDAAPYFKDWAPEYNYSPRQLRNIWKAVKGKPLT